MLTLDSLSLILSKFPMFLEGLWITIALVSSSLVIGFAIALICGLVIYYEIKIAKNLANTFVFVFRGTPLIIQIFFIYYGISQVEWVRESIFWFLFKHAYSCALLALSLNTAAYTTEIILGCMKNTPKTELEAARAFGLSEWQTLKRIILPSSFRRLIPFYGNEVVFMIQGSAVVSTITIMDLTGVAKRIYAMYYIPFESFIMAGLFYFVIITLVIALFKWLENKFLKSYTRR